MEYFGGSLSGLFGEKEEPSSESWIYQLKEIADYLGINYTSSHPEKAFPDENYLDDPFRGQFLQGFFTVPQQSFVNFEIVFSGARRAGFYPSRCF